MEQKILNAKNNYEEVDKFLVENHFQKLFIVFESVIRNHRIYKYFKTLYMRLGIDTVFFSDFTPNPIYDSICEGIKVYKENDCDLIVAIGGGSAMDVAKCIKLFSNMNITKKYLEQKIIANNIPLFAIPTTAGTGSEATRFAVIYYNGEKQSVSDESCIPQTVLYDSSLLKSLPTYQKKSTMLDAFSHSIESIWSVNSTEESKEYAKSALEIIINNMDKYLGENETVYEKMLMAANLAGKAINISQTTAGHAMCYKLTSMYKISHGHAAALINSELFPYMLENIERCADNRGIGYLKNTFMEIMKTFRCNDIRKGKQYIRNLLMKLDLYNIDFNIKDIDELTKSVNTVRLKNNPIKLESKDIKEIYTNLFKHIEEFK